MLNLSVETEGHRDAKDFELCTVVPVGSWVGGDLVLYELGLVLDLASCDVAAFRSADITHFNLDLQGYRASVVLHTDRDLLRAASSNRVHSDHGVMNGC